MKLENNFHQSSGKCTRHIDIRYFFVTDQIKNGEVWLEYCTTDLLIVDFYTKPLQGTLFRNFYKMILNLEDDVCNLGKKKDTNKSYKEAILNNNITTSQEYVGNND